MEILTLLRIFSKQFSSLNLSIPWRFTDKVNLMMSEINAPLFF